MAVAAASAAADLELPTDLVALGEVGLAGEVRRVGGLRARLSEAARLGFRQALVPADTGVESLDGLDGIRVVPVPDVAAALRTVSVLEGAGTGRVQPSHDRFPEPVLRVAP